MTETKRALIVVDVQNDFVEGGSMGVDGGLDVAERISAHIRDHADRYAAVVASRDWHDAHSDNGGHFHAPGTDPNFSTTWPVHCVSGEEGSQYAPGLDTSLITHHVRKGMGVPAYSAFEGVTDGGGTLAQLLAELDVRAVDVVGIATDYCVKATASDALDLGLEVSVLPDLHTGVAPETSEAALISLAEKGASV